jgi:serine/threonine protein kinase
MSRGAAADAKSSADDSQEVSGWANVDFSEIELGDQIGGGGVGLIYKGWWKDQPVALKTLFDARIGQELKKEYMDELLVMSKVKHANIVAFLGACMTPPNLCFIMELCECSLYQLLHVERMNFTINESIQVAVCTIIFLSFFRCRNLSIHAPFID